MSAFSSSCSSPDFEVISSSSDIEDNIELVDSKVISASVENVRIPNEICQPMMTETLVSDVPPVNITKFEISEEVYQAMLDRISQLEKTVGELSKKFEKSTIDPVLENQETSSEAISGISENKTEEETSEIKTEVPSVVVATNAVEEAKAEESEEEWDWGVPEKKEEPAQEKKELGPNPIATFTFEEYKRRQLLSGNQGFFQTPLQRQQENFNNTASQRRHLDNSRYDNSSRRYENNGRHQKTENFHDYSRRHPENDRREVFYRRSQENERRDDSSQRHQYNAGFQDYRRSEDNGRRDESFGRHQDNRNSYDSSQRHQDNGSFQDYRRPEDNIRHQDNRNSYDSSRRSERYEDSYRRYQENRRRDDSPRRNQVNRSFSSSPKTFNEAFSSYNQPKQYNEAFSSPQEPSYQKAPRTRFNESVQRVFDIRKHSHCVFCSGYHFPDQCKAITSVSERREVLKLAGRCTMCLGRHQTSKCYKPKYPCAYCVDHRADQHGPHHSCLCPLG